MLLFCIFMVPFACCCDPECEETCDGIRENCCHCKKQRRQNSRKQTAVIREQPAGSSDSSAGANSSSPPKTSATTTKSDGNVLATVRSSDDQVKKTMTITVSEDRLEMNKKSEEDD